MGTEHRPYVLPRVTEKGMIRLLLEDQHEIDLVPRDAAELAVQILKTHGLTYGISVDTYLWEQPMADFHRQQVDVPTLKVEGSGLITMRITASKSTIVRRIREHTLAHIRETLGID